MAETTLNDTMWATGYAAAMQEMEPYRSALAELVRLKRMKDSTGIDPIVATLDEVKSDNRKRDEYYKGRDAAWDAAFALIPEPGKGE